MPFTQPPFVRFLKSPLLRDSRFIGALSALLPGGSLLAWSHFVETRNLEISHHQALLEPGRDTLKVLHLSDLHFSKDNPWVRSILRQLQGIEADLVVITGDLLHIGAKEDVAPLLAALPDAPFGRYACLGNWDRWSGFTVDGLRSLFEGAGIQLLLNDHIPLMIRGRRLTLVGMDDALSGEPEPGLLSTLPEGVPTLVLSHVPTLFPDLASRGADIVLSGHTHGGQVRAPFKGALWMPMGSGDYDCGWFEEGGARLFVSRGIGTSVAPLRFLCRPEAALIEI